MYKYKQKGLKEYILALKEIKKNKSAKSLCIIIYVFSWKYFHMVHNILEYILKLKINLNNKEKGNKH